MCDNLKNSVGTNVLRAHVYIGASHSEFMIDQSPHSIAHFLMEHQKADTIIITDILDRFVLSSFGCFVDRCADCELLNQIMTDLVPLQNGILPLTSNAPQVDEESVASEVMKSVVLVFREAENDYMCWALDVHSTMLVEAKTLEESDSLEALMEKMPVRDSYDPEVLSAVRYINGQYELARFETPEGFMPFYECDGTSYRGNMNEIAEDIKEFLGTIGF